MGAIAKAVIAQRTGSFDPTTYRDRYQEALRELLEAKMKGLTVKPREIAAPPPVIDLMAALKRSLAREASGSKHTAPKKANKMAPDQRQPALLLPTFDFDGPRCPASFCVEPHQTVPTSRGADQFPKFVGLTAGESWIRTFGSATEKLPLGAPFGFRPRLPPARRGTDPKKDKKFKMPHGAPTVHLGIKRFQAPLQTWAGNVLATSLSQPGLGNVLAR